MSTRRALGRGIEALIPRTSVPDSGPYRSLPVSEIRVGGWQPRRRFLAEELRQLAESIKQNGVLQPILVRPAAGGYEVVAGERRLRAAREAGLSAVPAVVREVSDSEAVELALVENLQREDLSPIEEAVALDRLTREFGLSHQDIAERIGRDRSTVSNTIRLLSLPPAVKEQIEAGRLSAGHARALLGLRSSSEQVELGRKVVAGGLSVREAEAFVARGRSRVEGRQRRGVTPESGLAGLSEEMARALGTRVRIVGGSRRGRIIIEYYGTEDLTRLVDAVMGNGAGRGARQGNF